MFEKSKNINRFIYTYNFVLSIHSDYSRIFFADENITEVYVRVYGVMLDIPIPFPFDKPDVCKDVNDGVACPLQKDQKYHYTTSLFVQKIYPSVIGI